jgi:hypothetical protein
MKRLKNLLRFLIVAVIAVPLTPIVAAHAVEISGFDQLSECVRSEGTTNLNLFFLVDSSASLRKNDSGGPGTDPNDLRADVLSQAINQIAELNSDSVKVSFGLTTFDRTAPGNRKGAYPWTEANSGNASKASEWVKNKIPDQDFGPNTDWRAGLKEAKNQLAKAPNDGGTVCKAIIWFTDGELDVNGNKNQNAQAIQEMCGVGPTESFAKGDLGIVPSLRREGVVIIGVLLRAGEGQTSKGLVTFFGPIVAGSGNVDSSVFGGQSGQPFECGTNPIPQSYGHGSVIIATNPDDLAREFLKMIFIIKNGSPLPTNGKNEFTIEPGVSEVSVIIPSDKWQIEAPGKIGLIANNSKDSRFDIQTFGRTSTVVFKVGNDFLGKWKVNFQSATKDQITVFMQSGLRISVDKRHSTLTAGSGAQDISGFIKRGGDVADLSVYNQAKTTMTITQMDLTAQNRESAQKAMTIDPQGSWHGLFTPLEGAPKGAIKMTLQLVTKSGVVLPAITQTYTFDLLVPEAFCQIKSTKLKLSDLVYKPHAAAQGKLQVTGGNNGNCGIAFLSPVVNSDPLGRTSGDFAISILDEENGQVVKPGEWRQIEANAVKTYIVSVDNPVKANGDSVISIPVQRRTAESQQYVESSIEIDFKDVAVGQHLWPIALALLLLGLAIPFGILQMVNFLFARFRLGTASIAVVRVKVKINSNEQLTLTSLEEGKKILTENDFDSMPVHQKAEKSFDAETRGGDVVAKLKAKLPLNPFGNVSGLVIANSGEAIASCEAPRFLPDGSKAGAALNPNTYFFVTAAKSTEISETDDGVFYEATLTAFITDLIPGDPEGRVHNLRETVEQSDIWSEFAGVLTAKSAEGPSKKDKPAKEKKSKKVKNVKEVKIDADDPWNTDSFSSNYTSTSSSESPSQSKSAEKSKPATPPKVDEDDPWA